jgi:hypothetical protein
LVWVTVCAWAFKAVVRRARQRKRRKERRGKVALEKSDLFRFMETLRGLVANAIIAAK